MAAQSTVSLLRNSAEGVGRDRFTCTLAAWTLLIQVAEAFGWKPRGTTYTPTRVSNSTELRLRHDYQPGDVQDQKQVDADDAIAWAVALSEARRSPHLAAMVGASSDGTAFAAAESVADLPSSTMPFAAVMERFIEYAFAGAFSFARTARP